MYYAQILAKYPHYYTTDALRGQLQTSQAWWDDHAYDPVYNYDDKERAEMRADIDELKATIAQREEQAS